METLIQEEIRALNHSLSNDLNKPITIKNKFNISVINALWTLIAGHRFELDNPELLDLVKKVDKLTETSLKDPLNVFPWLRHVAPDLSGWTENCKKMVDVITFIKKTIDEHFSNFDAAGMMNVVTRSHLGN